MNLKNVIVKAIHNYEEEQSKINHDVNPIVPKRHQSHLSPGERTITYVEMGEMKKKENFPFNDKK